MNLKRTPSPHADQSRRRQAREPEHLTLDETADWLRCSTRTLQRLLEAGNGPPVIRLSERRIIFRLAEVRDWLVARTRGGAERTPSRRRGRPRQAAQAEVEAL